MGNDHIIDGFIRNGLRIIMHLDIRRDERDEAIRPMNRSMTEVYGTKTLLDLESYTTDHNSWMEN
jgi:hypothetical protein